MLHLKASYLIFLFYTLMIPFTSIYSQNKIIKGKIIDKESKEIIRGATVSIAKTNKTISDSKGEFTIFISSSGNVVKKIDLSFSSIGYIPKQISASPGQQYVEIKLEKNIQALDEIVVSDRGRNLVKEAILRIKDNYPSRDMISTGIMRVTEMVDTAYYYSGDASVKVFLPSYSSKNEKQKISVEHIESTVLEDSTQKWFLKGRWIGGFSRIHDIIFKRPAFLQFSKLDDFIYRIPARKIINGRVAYEIQFISKKGNKIEGVLEIDSTSLAFAKVYYKIQNPAASLGFYPVAVVSVEAVYKLYGENWVIHNTHLETMYNDKITGRGVIDFVALKFRNSDSPDFEYPDIVQKSDEDRKIKKRSDEINWKAYENLITQQEAAGAFTVLPPLKIDTTRNNNVHFTGKNKIVKYLINNNMKREFSLHKFPIQMTEKNKRIAEYGIGLGMSFRLYKSVFVKGFVNSNFGISRVSLRRRSLLLSNDIVFNKTNRPATITIGTGLSTTTLKEKSLDQFRKSYNWESSIYLSFEQTRKRNFFITFSYYHPLKRDKATPFANFTSYSVGVGYVFDKN